MRVRELISGVRTEVGIKIFGDDMDTLLDKANKVAAVIRKVPGAVEVTVEQVTGRPYFTIQIKREVMSRYGLTVDDVQSVIEAAIGGRESGAIFEGDRRFPLVVRLPEDFAPIPMLCVAFRSRSRTRNGEPNTGPSLTSSPPSSLWAKSPTSRWRSAPAKSAARTENDR